MMRSKRLSERMSERMSERTSEWISEWPSTYVLILGFPKPQCSGPAGEVNVDGCSHAGAEIGGAGSEVTPLLRKHEVAPGVFDDGATKGGQTTSQTVVHANYVATCSEKTWQ